MERRTHESQNLDPDRFGRSHVDRWAIRAEYQRTGQIEETFLAGETELERMSLSVLFRL